MNLNLDKKEERLQEVFPEKKYYVASYKRYITTKGPIPDFIFKKDEIELGSGEELTQNIKNAIAQIALFNQENKKEVQKGEIGNYYIQQKLINE